MDEIEEEAEGRNRRRLVSGAFQSANEVEEPREA